MYKKILLPTDGSEPALKAGKHAMWIAGQSNAEIIALHVIDMSTFSGLPTKEAKKRVKEMLIKEGKKSFDEVVDLSIRCKQKYNRKLKMTFVTKEGHPADEILKTIEEEGVDLVVMGTAGKHGINRFLLGSVAQNVVRSGSCPVLVVR
jgi:nucleotide-binding universal stress UspA family protein